MKYLTESDKELFITLEQLLLDSKVRLAMTSDVGTSTEICRDKIRIAAKNVTEVEKILVCLMTMRGPLKPNFGWRFISAQRMYVEVKKEVKNWSSKLFGTKFLELSSFGEIYEHIEGHYDISYPGQFRPKIFLKQSKKNT